MAFWDVNKTNPDILGPIVSPQDRSAQQWYDFDLATTLEQSKSGDPGLHRQDAAKSLWEKFNLFQLKSPADMCVLQGL